jgi:hypothetical protein
MKAFVRLALLSLAVTVACQAGLALAKDYSRLSGEGETASAADDQKDAAAAQSPCVEDSKCAGQCSGNSGCGCSVCSAAHSCCPVWFIDYRIRSMFNSHTSQQFGGESPLTGPYAPMSKLDWSLDSMWHGLQIGVEKPNWGAHLEWLMPMQRNINGDMVDYDWNIWDPRNDPTRLDSLTRSSERWNDGQMLELEAEFKLTECFFTLPLEVWPLAGFRFQRFNMTAQDIFHEVLLTRVVSPLGSLQPYNGYDGVDVVSFNQQYYIGYIGAQLRGTLEVGCLPIDVRFQGDWGPTSGYNVDHHLVREGDLHGMQSTQGDAWHLALIAEAPLSCRCSLGLQLDHMAIRTTGTLHQVYYGQDIISDYGVSVKSDQSSLTMFLRAHF